MNCAVRGHLWVSLPPGIDDAVVTAEARQAGVLVSAGGRYFAAEKPGGWVRFNFAAADPTDLTDLTEAAHRLARI